jgi:chitin synthase
MDLSFMDLNNPPIPQDPLHNNPNLLHTLVMVPCYSEGRNSLKTTLDSIVNTDYPSTHKCVVVISDGIVQGHGNDKPTHEFALEMMEIDHRFRHEDPKCGGDAPAYSYVAIADGNKRKNYAKVYVGWYSLYEQIGRKHDSMNSGNSSGTRDSDDVPDRTGTKYTLKKIKKGCMPMLLIVKVGNEEERLNGNKPGNRGKRDSQLIIMNFLSKVMFDDRMTELEFDLFFKLWTITGVNPERFETVLTIDSDTKVYPDSLRHMVTAMVKDPNVIGLCGETKVGNPFDSFTTTIQVFEYFISHHLSKAFESTFGIVTCLPGCFSLYRIRAPKGPGTFVPILANPDIVEGTHTYIMGC